jgi:NarL family two-component system response regulator LiaR
MGERKGTQSDQIRLMIVDDHSMIRDGLKTFLLVYRDLALVGEAGDGEEAVRLCDELRPDVVLMDLKMPGMDGVEATRAIRARQPQVQILVLTSFADEALVAEAMQAGAIGYLLKDVSAPRLADAIREAHAGRPTLAPAAAQALVHAASQAPPTRFDLTEREIEVLALLAEGLSNPQIAGRLSISRSTANFHVGNILSKLGAANRTEAAHLARAHNLIP